MRELGLYELRGRLDRVGEFVPGSDLLDAVGERWRYFSVLPRVRRGAKKEDVVPSGNLLWLDVDSREALEHLGSFEELELAPSAVVDSGGGFWCYWKLAELVPSETLEAWNRRLNRYAAERLPGVDKGCWNRNRTARLVGAVHEETGVEAHVVAEVSTWQLYRPARVEAVLPVAPEGAVMREGLSVSPGRFDRGELRGVFNRFGWYLDDPPLREEIYARGQTRAGIEFALVLALIEDGDCSDEEIRDLFDEWLPLKHAEKLREVPGNPYGYLELTIKNARAKADPERGRKRRRESKRAYTQVDRVLVLTLLAEAEDEGRPLLVKEACEWIVESGCSPRTAELVISQLYKGGLVEKVKNPGGRGKHCSGCSG
jgi:hypothetical protein